VFEQILATEALAAIGPLAKAAKPALQKAADATEPELRKAVADALNAIGDQ
jgi:hypothetical protein